MGSSYPSPFGCHRWLKMVKSRAISAPTCSPAQWPKGYTSEHGLRRSAGQGPGGILCLAHVARFSGRETRHCIGGIARPHCVRRKNSYEGSSIWGEEILVAGEGTKVGSIGVQTVRSFRLQRVGTSHPQMRQRSRPTISNDPTVIENLLKFKRGRAALSSCQVCLAAYIQVIEAGDIGNELDLSQLDA